MTVEHLPEQPLADAAADFRSARQTPREFNDAMIDEGDARFQRHRHAGPVDLRKNVVGQVSDKIEKLHSLE